MSSPPVTTVPRQACLDFFASLCPLSDTTRTFLEQRLIVQELAKDALLLTTDKVVNELYYIHEGLVRNYYFDGRGNDTTGWFAAETEVLYFPTSYRDQMPLPGHVQLLEKSTLVSLTYDELNELYELDPAANALGRRLSENQMQYLLKRERLFRSRESGERYLKFLELFPHLDGRVQNQHVASYLVLSPGTISRVLSGKMGGKKEPSKTKPLPKKKPSPPKNKPSASKKKKK